MIVTTTPSVEGRRITAYHGVVVGEVILWVEMLGVGAFSEAIA